jgi:hypothetical protein
MKILVAIFVPQLVITHSERRRRREIILLEASPMSGVFQNIDPPTPSPPGECVPPRLWCGGRTHSLGEEGVGGGVNILEDARHSSVLYICKYFVGGGVNNCSFICS